MIEGKETPVDAGYDKYGNVTRKPEDVIERKSMCRFKKVSVLSG